jgi:hypothetical protein
VSPFKSPVKTRIWLRISSGDGNHELRTASAKRRPFLLTYLRLSFTSSSPSHPHYQGYLRTVVRNDVYRLPPNVSSLPATGAALRLPKSFRPELGSAFRRKAGTAGSSQANFQTQLVIRMRIYTERSLITPTAIGIDLPMFEWKVAKVICSKERRCSPAGSAFATPR